MTDAARDAELPYGIRPVGYRLPDETHLGRVRLQVADLDRSIEYYHEVLGLRVIERREGVAVLGPVSGDPIVELDELPGANPVPRRGRIGLYHFAILLPDRASLGRFVLHLAQIGARAGMSDHLVSEAIYLTDPDGLGIEVYADRPRETWAHSERQLAMSTDPLDVEDLVAAGRDAQWTGMPSGTTIGHVHLHVADLAEAERFYHETLGFDKVVWSYPGALFLSAGGYHHHLGTNTWAMGAQPAGERDARLLDWEIVLPGAADVEAAARHLEKNGYAVRREGGRVHTADPWGTRLVLVASA